MTETEVGIGLTGPLLHAQTLGHEQRGGRSPGKEGVGPIPANHTGNGRAALQSLGWRMVAGMSERYRMVLRS